MKNLGKKKTPFIGKIFGKGASLAGHILMNLHENGEIAKEGFLRNCPQYPGFGLIRALFGCKENPRKIKVATVRTNLFRLEKEGLIRQDFIQKTYSITNKGKKIASYIKSRYLIPEQKWDGKLRIVIFDIPEKKKVWRKFFKRELEYMQFKQLQKSVYIGKYPISKSLIEEMEKDDLGDNIFIFTADQIDRKDEILKLLKENQ